MPVYQISPTKWTNKPPQQPRAQSDLPRPYIISDEMPLTEQVDGRFYSSKRAFRATGRAHGLVEVGNDPARFRTKMRETARRETKVQRRRRLERAIAEYRQGRRPREG